MNIEIVKLANTIPYQEIIMDYGRTLAVSLKYNCNSLDLAKLSSIFEKMKQTDNKINAISYNRSMNQIIISEMGE